MIDANIEKRVLSSLVSATANISILQQRSIDTSFFTLPETKKLFDIIVWYYGSYGQGLQSDSLADILANSQYISEELQKKIAVLFEELKIVSVSSNFEFLLDELVIYNKTNMFTNALDKAVEQLSDKNIDGAMSSLKSTLYTIEKKNSGSLIMPGCGFMGDNAQKMKDEQQDRELYPEKYMGIKIGFPTYDQAVMGHRPGQVAIIVGQMKGAKSVLVTNIAYNVAASGKKVFMHINEGQEGCELDLVQRRIISCGTGIIYDHIKNNTLTPDDKILFDQFLKNPILNNIYIDASRPSLSNTMSISEKLKELKERGTPMDLVIVDMFGNLQPSAKSSKHDTWEMLGKLAWELKDLAGEHKIPIICTHHVNTEGMDSKGGSFKLQHFGLTREAPKYIDSIISWRLKDEAAFNLNNKGTGVLSIMGARDSVTSTIEVDINTNIMKISEHVMKIGH